jgi:O-antigen ligase
MISGAEPLSYFFRWRHLGHQFTEVADTHPTYLAVFIVVSIFFLIQDSKTSNNLKSILIPLLILGLFQLASRIALFLMILLVIFILVKRFRGNKWQTASVVFGIVFGSLLVIYYGSEYLTSRIFSENAIVNDRRMIRWEVSYEIFKNDPLVGVGYDRITSLRREGYLHYGFEAGALEEYNAHNQLLEFLSTQGAIGGFIYVTSLAYLFFLAIYQRQVLFAFVFFAFFIACSAESMLVRIKGIEYLAIFGTLFLSVVYSSNPADEDLHNT